MTNWSARRKIQEPWTYIIRAVWIALALLLLATFVAGISPRFNELREVCATEDCVVLALSQQEADVLRDIGLSMASYAGFHITIEALGASVVSLLAGLIFWRRFDDWMGVLVAFMLMLFGLNFMMESDGALVRQFPNLEFSHTLLTSLSSVLFILLFCLFPDGRFVPRWTRLAAAVLAATALIEPLLRARASLIPSGQLSVVLLYLILGCLIIGVFAQIYRYRRVSSPAQRQQTKWVVLGLMCLIAPVFAWSLFVELHPLQPGVPRLLFNTIAYGILAFVFMLFPISVFFSIARYRLWDIDLIIRRTLVYSALTGLLVLVYAGLIVLLQALFHLLTGQQSQLAIVISTLFIAALFAPLRRRVQAFIDRRFYRRKYNSQRTLEAFSSSMRDEVDMDHLQSALVSVVRETMQPAHIGLWLNEGE